MTSRSTVRPSPTELEREQAKEKIVEAAFAIGAKQGLIGISARSVARDAGVSVGYLYKLFPSKSDIMVAAAERYFERTLYQQLCRIEPGQDYVDYCQKLWDCTATTFGGVSPRLAARERGPAQTRSPSRPDPHG